MQVKDFLRHYFTEIELIEIISNLFSKKEALLEYNSFIKKYPGIETNYQTLFTLAHIYYDYYEFDTALKIFKKSLK